MGIRNVVLQTATTSLFGPLVAILALYLVQPINEVMCMVTDWGKAETVRAWKKI